MDSARNDPQENRREQISNRVFLLHGGIQIERTTEMNAILGVERERAMRAACHEDDASSWVVISLLKIAKNGQSFEKLLCEDVFRLTADLRWWPIGVAR